MIEIGRYQVLEVVKKVSFGLYLGPGDDAILLPGKYVAEGTDVGDRVRVFVYHDSEDRPVATTATPRAALGEIAAMQVVDVTPHGAFLDWGLEKDLFVPNKEQFRRMVVGSTHVVEVRMDERTGRLIGSGRLATFFDYDVAHLRPGREVDLLVYGANEVGALVVVEGRHAGLVYHGEATKQLAVGAELKGYIERVRDDNKIDVCSSKRGRPAQLDAQAVILGALEHTADGFLSLHDKSPADEIGRRLEMSKKVFKAAIGGLYKRGAIDLEPTGIRLRRS